ncbi:hypothetical protein Lesp02_51450 [Lentzea sp. NBRC 105346]|uniref:hypothetical protein n=1 Tax=Lentzea sp. NBRC 105346 TaxID=3032205 RepID=UPI0024A4DF02|nr:hypothetical protein [Lentzea sp. NBRC 105346]GLZ32957.1 hypothetical protein Lesp02_51450 [Lentzea sp. NBRC 105346]
MGQLSFFSAEARTPGVADLAGLLCGPGQAMGFARGTAARVSVALRDEWRAAPLRQVCAERGVTSEICMSEDGSRIVRTPFRTDLTGLAARWLDGTTKVVPRDFTLDGAILRVWALASGHWVESAYLLGLDPDAPGTHEPLKNALLASGLPCTLVDAPALRVTGRRRLARLAELVGRPPRGVAERTWPAA